MPHPYRPPRWLINGHAQTVVPSFRRVLEVGYERERITTPDDDFLDLDWSRVGADRLVVVLHGLEGCAHRPYVQGMVRAFNRRGWDALAMNYRGCSGELNRRLRSYHAGATDDVHLVLTHALATDRYRIAVLVGFSLGGNLTIKYIGEQPESLDPRIKKAVAFSVPCDPSAGAAQLERPANAVYLWRFLQTLNMKALHKHRMAPDRLPDPSVRPPRTLRDYDDRYTAPIHGFRSADQYYTAVSARRYIPLVRIPTLIVNALNDPFLPPSCYPVAEAKASPFVTLEMPYGGGHIGFPTVDPDGEYWSERRACAFMDDL